MEERKRQKETPKLNLLSKVQSILDSELIEISRHDEKLKEFVDVERLSKSAKSKYHFYFMLDATALLLRLADSVDGFSLVPTFVGKKLLLTVLCQHCTIDESIELAVLINEFIGIKLVDKLDFISSNAEYADYSSQLLVEVDPEDLWEGDN